jgi:hypothetical protein
VVPATGVVIWMPLLQHRCRHMVCRLHLCGADATYSIPPRRKRHGSTQDHLPCIGNADGRRMAGMCEPNALFLFSSLFTPFCNTRNGESLLLQSFLSTFYVAPQGHTKLPDYVSVGQFPKTPLRDLFTAASADTLNLLSRCISYEPRRRISAKEVRSPPSPFPLTCCLLY